MFILKYLSLNNIIIYTIYAIFIVILLFLIYKYLYLEQAVYLINNKLERFENDLSNSSCCPLNSSSLNQNSNSNMMKNAEIIMNEIFNIDALPSCPRPQSQQPVKSNKIEPVEEIVPVLEEPTITKNSNLFDLKRKNDNNLKDNKDDKDNKDNKDDRDLKDDRDDKEINDKESVISSIIGGGHAVKKSLMKLSIDKLKAKCEERKLSTEGTKNQLADRIIVFDNENSQE